MNVLWEASTEELVLLAAMVLCLIAALGFLITAFKARKSERLDRRLQHFLTDEKESEKPLPQPMRIDLEKEAQEGAGSSKNFWHLTFGDKGPGRLTLSRRFIQAGIDPARGKRLFVAARIFCVVLSATVAAILLNNLALPIGLYLSVGVVLAAGICGSFWPYYFLNYHIQQRQRRIERAMPDMIDLLILCVEAGLTLEVALARAIEGLEPFAPDVAAEMKITLSELKILPDKSMALTNLEERTASKSLKYLVLSLRQSEKYGTSITGALKAVAAENRKHRMLELENNAARMPALLSIPLILFILPPVVALSAGPGFALMMRTIGG
jgi:tight adherence protein C